MDIYMKALREFHTKYGHYSADVPHIPPRETVELREKLIKEEVQEFLDESFVPHTAVFVREREQIILHLVEVADALADTLYVVFGTALAYGIDIEKVFMEVHRSNMTKSMLKDEKSIKGKTIKGPDYDPPNIRQFIDISSLGEE